MVCVHFARNSWFLPQGYTLIRGKITCFEPTEAASAPFGLIFFEKKIPSTNLAICVFLREMDIGGRVKSVPVSPLETDN